MREVRHELVMLPYYGVFDNLAYSVNGGRGNALRPGNTAHAEERRRKRGEANRRSDKGGKQNPGSAALPIDWQIRRATFRAIYSEPALSTKYAYQAIPPIHIIVDNGKVTLEGVVDSEADKNLAGLRANQVSGVFSVTNNLVVEK